MYICAEHFLYMLLPSYSNKKLNYISFLMVRAKFFVLQTPRRNYEAFCFSSKRKKNIVANTAVLSRFNVKQCIFKCKYPSFLNFLFQYFWISNTFKVVPLSSKYFNFVSMRFTYRWHLSNQKSNKSVYLTKTNFVNIKYIQHI